MSHPSGEEDEQAHWDADADAIDDIEVPRLPAGLGDSMDGPSEGQPDAAAASPSGKKKRRPRSRVDAFQFKDLDGPEAKLEANQSLLSLSLRMSDACSELAKYTAVLSDDSPANKGRQAAAIANMQSAIVPFLHIASRNLRSVAMSFAPYGGCDNMARRNDTEVKRTKSSTGDRSVDVQMIDEFVRKSNVQLTHKLRRSLDGGGTGRTSAASHVVAPGETIEIIRPKDGSTYTRSEAITVATMYQKGSRERVNAMRAISSHGFCKSSAKTVYKLVHQVVDKKEEIKGDKFPRKGRPNLHFPPGMGPDQTVVRVSAVGVSPHSVCFAPISSHSLQIIPEGERDLITVPVYKPGCEDDGSSKKRPAEDLTVDDDNDDEDTLRPVKASKSKKSRKQKKSKETPDYGETLSPRGKPAASKPASASAAGKPPPPSPPASRQTEASSKKTVEEIRATTEAEVINYPLPPPANGSQYTKREAVDLVLKTAKASVQRRWCMEAMIYKGYVPATVKTIYRVVHKEERGEPLLDTDWGGNGRPALLTNGEVDAIVSEMKGGGCEIFSRADIEKILIAAVREKHIRQGGSEDGARTKFPSATIKNYCTIVQCKMGGTFRWTEI